MFWRFGFHNPSPIDTLLDREDIKLEELFEEEDLLQEAKSHNQKLVEFLLKPENLALLLHYVTAPDLEESQRFKYPYLASEIIACEIPQMIDAIVMEHRPLLESLWAYLDRPAASRRRLDIPTETENNGLDPLQASYFCKVINICMAKHTSEMIQFITSKPENLKKILSHLQISSVMDLLLTLVRIEELQEGKGTVQWLSDHGLLEDLVDRLDPYLDSEEHSIAQQCLCEIIRLSQTSILESPSIGVNELIIQLKSQSVMEKLTLFMLDKTAPNSTSTLTNSVAIIIDLIRHNNNDMDSEIGLEENYPCQNGQLERDDSVSLEEMLKVLADHVGDFSNILLNPKSSALTTAVGTNVPLGFERLKICELFAELLHCSNMINLNASIIEDSQVEDSFDTERTTTAETSNLPMGDYLKQKFIEHKVMPICIQLFFAFPWNNFLHYVVYDMLHQVLNGRMDKGFNRQLTISVLVDGQLTDLIIKGQATNDIESAKFKGTRLGYMGHLTFIADEIVKVFEGYPESIVNAIKSSVDLEQWTHYCNNELKDTKERDRLPLGGARPQDDPIAMNEEEEEFSRSVTNQVSIESHSQFSRYLVHRSGNNRVDDEEENGDHWTM
ncbi:SIT4 phosphatase-associated protein-domain-containing protein [Spinellus fusiger]|nr:SIT4 phosphatase-associated protein-domain-containing protein [Spinellus fusiger]